MATHSSVLAREISWTEEAGGLQSVGSQESDMTYEKMIRKFQKRLRCLQKFQIQHFAVEFYFQLSISLFCFLLCFAPVPLLLLSSPAQHVHVC